MPGLMKPGTEKLNDPNDPNFDILCRNTCGTFQVSTPRRMLHVNWLLEPAAVGLGWMCQVAHQPRCPSHLGSRSRKEVLIEVDWD